MTSPDTPPIQTTVVGSYPIPDWLAALPSEQALVDATAVVFQTQELAGIDLVVDGEMYRFDVNHPDTNGMIEYFVRPLGGVRSQVGRQDVDAFSGLQGMGFRRKPAGVVENPITEGTLDLVNDYHRARAMTRAPLKFTLTGPHMLSKTLLDRHYGNPVDLAQAIAQVLAEQVRHIDAQVIQLDEANITGHPEEADWAVPVLNHVLQAIPGKKAMHLCFGNYGGQTIQKGTWDRLIGFLNQLHLDHVVLEMSRRTSQEMSALQDLNPKIGIGLGVIDIKTNVVESPDEVADRIAQAEKLLGTDRVKFVHPDCGFWMLKRSVADRKMQALVQGRDRYLGR